MSSTELNTPTVYLAGPIHHATDGGHRWRNMVTDRYGDRFNWINPLDDYDGNTVTVLPEEMAETYEPDADEQVVTDADVVETDKRHVAESDAMLIGFREKVPTWGTPMENALAYRTDAVGNTAPNMPVATWHGMLSVEELSPWLRYHSTYRSGSLEDVIRYLEATLGTSVVCADCLKGSGARLTDVRFQVADRDCEWCGSTLGLVRDVSVHA